MRHLIQGSVLVPLIVENLIIESPLILTEEEPRQIQIVCNSLSEQGEVKYETDIFCQTSFLYSGRDSGKWKKVASAKFHPLVSIQENHISYNLDQVKLKLTNRCDVNDIYTKIESTGIKFGPLFKSARKIWYSDNEILVKINLLEGFEKFVANPIALDAMLQIHLIDSLIDSFDVSNLQLAVWIEKFCIFE